MSGEDPTIEMGSDDSGEMNRVITRTRPADTDSIEGGSEARWLSRWGPPFIALLAGLLVWQAFSGFDLGRVPLPGSWEIIYETFTYGTTAEFWRAAAASARVFLQGFAPGLIVAVVVGLAIGNTRILRASLGPIFFALYTTPFIALIPLFLVAFGFGLLGKTAIVFFLVFITVVLQTLAGVRNADPTYSEVSAAFRTPWWRHWFGVSLPAALPFIVAGVRLGIGRALVGVVVAEFETVVTGLGSIILIQAQALQVARATVPAIFLAIVGITLTAALRRVERGLQVWKT